MKSGGKYYEALKRLECFNYLELYVDDNKLDEAYDLLLDKSIYTTPLTYYLIDERNAAYKYGKRIGSTQRDEPLDYLTCVPKGYMYEFDENDLYDGKPYYVYIRRKEITEIKDYAFQNCSITELHIPKRINKIGDSALCLKKGKIYYEGTKSEFIEKFLGKSKCFLGANGQELICSDGTIEFK